MTLSLFLLPPMFLSRLVHFLPSADTGGRDSRRGGTAPQPLLPWGCIPLWCLVWWQSSPRGSWGVAGGSQAHRRRNCWHITLEQLWENHRQTTDRGLKTPPTWLPCMKDCDLVASLLYEGPCACPMQIPTTCPTRIHLNTRVNYICYH